MIKKGTQKYVNKIPGNLSFTITFNTHYFTPKLYFKKNLI